MTPDVSALLQQLTQSLSANTQAILKLQNEFNTSRQDINNRFEQINSRLATLESNQASSSTRTTGQLPGKSIQNPKEFNVSAITIIKNEDFIDAQKEDIIPEDSNVLGGEASLKAQNTINNAEVLAHPAPTAPTLSEELIMPTFAYSIAPPIYNTRRLDDYTILPHKLLRQYESNPAPQKLSDPGAITVPCSIKHISFPRCICDSGAAISVMPLSVADRLGLFTYKTCDYSLLLADRTLRTPYGVLENVPLCIGGIEVPTDFVVLEIDEEPKDPILLGRPFLASTRALIDMAGESIELNLGGNNFFKFRINEEARSPPARTFDAPLKKHRANDHQTVVLEPAAPRGDTPTYRVTCGRKPTPYEMISHLRPLHLLPLASSGPFAIKEVKRDGSITLSGPPGATMPFIGQGVSLCLTDPERSARPLSKPFT